jgi:hypothetical protein
MSEIDTTAGFTADENVSVPSEGLGDESFETFEDTSTPSESFDGSESAVQESSVSDGLFEVDGAQITLDEARNGFLRQSDYTKKTQELAEMRSRLTQAEAITAALERDPIATLQALQEAFGVGLDQETDPYVDVDPESARIAAIEARFAKQDEAARQHAIDNELKGLHGSFGDFDDSELFNHAIRGDFPSLQAAYADMNFTRVQQELQSLRDRQSEVDSRQASAREANEVVHGGGGRASAAAPVQPAQYSGIREAYMAAKKALGA